MELKTHLGIRPELCGSIYRLEPDCCEVHLPTTPQMVADAEGLVHGGFVFGAADFAAMALLNTPFVVLAGAECRFLRPVKVGQTVVCTATLKASEGRKALVDVVATCEGTAVFQATFKCARLDRHVLDS